MAAAALCCSACPIALPAESQTRFACTAAEDCPPGQHCLQRLCVAVDTDAAAPADRVANDQTGLDRAAIADSAADTVRPDHPADAAPRPDHPAADVRDAAAADQPTFDRAAADSRAHDAMVDTGGNRDSAAGDAALPDTAVRDTTRTDACVASGSETTPSGNCADGFDNDCDGNVDEHDDGCWWDARWSHRRKLTFDNSSRPALDTFTVLLVLHAGRIDYGELRSDGADLRIVDADNSTLLPLETEAWNTSGTSLVWVRVPRIDAASTVDFIWMYYGRSDATAAQQPAQVWSGYDAVYHLTDLQDATGHGNNGTDHGTSAGTGQIGGGRSFDGANAWIGLGSDRSLLRSAGAATLSAWIDTSDYNLNQDIISVAVGGACSNNSRATLISEYGNIRVGARAGDLDGLIAMNTADQPVQTGRWQYLVGVIDYGGGNLSSYIDGRLDLSNPFTFNQLATSSTNAGCAAIGSEDSGDLARFAGTIDEVRISPVLRSAAWIDAEFKNQGADAFVTYGSAQTH